MKYLDKESFPDIIFEDNHILVAVKPSNMLTQPDASEKISLEDILKKYLKEKYNKEGNVFLHALHRLDKDVSGLVLFAKSSKALSRLNQQMRDKEIKKEYLALVEGKVAEKKGKLVNFIHHADYKAVILEKMGKDGKKAELYFEVIEGFIDSTLLKIDLITGRYHQIRAQLSYFGHPILGDKKYGSKINRNGIALHCYLLSFIHPVLNKELLFKSEKQF